VRLKVSVDLDVCRGHGLCVDAAPEVFRLGNEGLCDLLMPFPPEDLRTQVEAAVECCPVAAIVLEA
jgi:ferredoxin